MTQHGNTESLYSQPAPYIEFVGFLLCMKQAVIEGWFHKKGIYPQNGDKAKGLFPPTAPPPLQPYSRWQNLYLLF